MRRFLVRFIRPESFVHNRSSVGFTIITSGFEFSVHTRPIRSNLGVPTGAATVCTRPGRIASDGRSIRNAKLSLAFVRARSSQNIGAHFSRSGSRNGLSRLLSPLCIEHAQEKQIATEHGDE